MAVFQRRELNRLNSTYCLTEVETDRLVFTPDKEHAQIEQNITDKGLLTKEVVNTSFNNQLSLCNDGGILLVWGCGEFGQHGHGHQNDVALTNGVHHPLLIGQDGIVTMVACGSSHTICITDDCRIYSWGNGNSGQLGIGNTTTVFQPNIVQLGISLGTRIKGVACGTRHTFVWTDEGDCYSFGNNFSAQLGYDFRKPNFKENQPSPTYIEHLFNQKVIQVACGSRHSLFLFTSGLVASVGSNDRGQLGLDSKTSSVCIKTVPDKQDIAVIGCGNCHCLAADGSGNIYAWGYGKACGSKDDILSPKCLCKYENKSIKAVDGGDSHSMVLFKDGSLFSWGVNFEGQLGLGDGIKFQSFPAEVRSGGLQGNIASISLGENTSAAVTGDGVLYMWGRNVTQIIRDDEGPRYCQFVPCLVSLSNWKAKKVSLGSWHVVCIATSCDSTPKEHLSESQYKRKEEIPSNQSTKNSQETPIVQEEFDAKDVPSVENDENTLGKQMDLNLNIYSDNNVQNSRQDEIALNSSVCSEAELTKPSNNESIEVPIKIHSYLERPSNLRRTQSEDSCTFNSIPKEMQPPKQVNLDHLSKSLCDFPTEICPEKESFQVQQNSAGQLRKNSMLSGLSENRNKRNNARNVIIKGSKPQDHSANLPNAVVAQIDSSHPVTPPKTVIRPIDSSHPVTPSNRGIGPIDSSHLVTPSNTVIGPIDSSHPVTPSSTVTGPIDSSHLVTPSNTNTKIRISGQLCREKKQPRQLRQVPLAKDSISDVQNSPLSCTNDRRSPHSVQRQHSSPTMKISNLKLEVCPSSQSTSTTTELTHTPHPPSKPNSGLPPRHPGPRRSHSQKIFYSSGSSWRKRDPNMR